jgi:hypothetical protein
MAVARLLQAVDGGVSSDIDGGLLADTEDERTGILHAPLHVGHDKVGGQVDAGRAGHLRGDSESQWVVVSVNRKRAVDGDLLGRARAQGAGDLFRMEDGLRVGLALEDILLHPAVARGTAALAAVEVHEQFALGGAGDRIECDQAALEIKSAMDGVQDVVKSPVDPGVSRIEVQRDLLRVALRGKGRHSHKEGGAENEGALQADSLHSELCEMRRQQLGTHRRSVAESKAGQGLFANMDSEHFEE